MDESTTGAKLLSFTASMTVFKYAPVSLLPCGTGSPKREASAMDAAGFSGDGAACVL